MCVAFQEAKQALLWCMHVQLELLKAEWPQELLQHPTAAQEWADVQDDIVIFKVSRPVYHAPTLSQRPCECA